MKMKVWLVLLLFTPFLIGGCSNKTNIAEKKVENERKNTSDIDMDLIEKLTGTWVSEGEAEIYHISITKESENTFRYADNLENKDSQLLKVEEAFEESISALTEDEATRYSFIFSDTNRMTSFMGVNPDYYSEKGEEIPVGMSKPIEYMRIID